MTDELMNESPDLTDQQPNMITEEQLKGRLAQQARKHQKELESYKSRLDTLEQNYEPRSDIGDVAAQNVIDAGKQSPTYVPPNIDINELASRITAAQTQAQQAEQARREQQAYADKMHQLNQSTVDKVNESANQDPEFMQMLNDPTKAINHNQVVQDLYGEEMPGGVLKQLISNDDMRNEYNNAQTPLERQGIIRRASKILNTQVTANNMSRGTNSRLPSTRGSTTGSLNTLKTPSEIRQYYKDKGNY